MPMMVEEGVAVVRKMMIVCRSLRIDELLFSIISTVCFVYRFCLGWN